MSGRALTVANQITILRLIFVPLFAILTIDSHYRASLGVLALATASDIADGTVARWFHQQSSLGMVLDPFADKLLITTAYLVLSFSGALPWWLTILVLSRDAGIVVIALLISLVSGYRPFPPTVLGKASTIAQVATVLASVSELARTGFVTPGVVRGFIYLAAALTILSGIHYLIVARKRFEHPGHLEAP